MTNIVNLKANTITVDLSQFSAVLNALSRSGRYLERGCSHCPVDAETERKGEYESPCFKAGCYISLLAHFGLDADAIPFDDTNIDTYTIDAYKLALLNTTTSLRDAVGITPSVEEIMDGALDAAAKTLAAEAEEAVI